MCRVIGMWDRIVPQGQMAPRINRPQRARVARARATLWGLWWAPVFRAPCTSCVGAGCCGELGCGRAGSSLVRRRGRTKRSVWVWGFVIPCARKVNVVQLLGNAGAAPGAGRKARVPGGAVPCPPVAAGAAACSAGAAEQAVPAAP